MKSIYRCWHKIEKRWAAVCEVAILPDGWVASNMSGLDEGPDYWITQMFTGLRDKNNLPIYEDDIIKFYPYKNEKEHYIMGSVEYLECKYILNNRIFKFKNPPSMDFQDLDYYHSCGFDKEVIGNIFENPELIKT